jgi:SAM-dependent methyltransferase
MGHAEWGADPEFFGPRHAHREGRILNRVAAESPSGPHLECAAGVGSLSNSLARCGRTVVAADLSLRSLAEVRRRAPEGVHPVMADILRLPFRDGAFTSATSAETLEHIPDHSGAVRELARVLAPGGSLSGTVPAGPDQWSDWDVWADHQRRYTRADMERVLSDAGLDPRVTVWGWPVLRLYDDLFLKRVNRRRLATEGSVDHDPHLRRVSGLGRRPWLVRLVRTVFEFDRLFDGAPWGVGLIFTGRKPTR